MKTKLLLTGIISATLLLGACGNDEAEKKDDSKKSESVEKKKEAPKKDESKKDTDKKDNESTEQVATEEPQSQEQQPAQQEPTEQEKTEANKEWAKKNIKGGTDAGMLDPSVQPDSYYSNDQLDPDTGLPKDDAVPHKVGENIETTEETSEWVKGQDEWMNASDAEREEIRKADAEKYGYEYDPEDFE